MQQISALNQQAIKELISSQWGNYHRNIAISVATIPLIFITPSILNRQDPFHITGRVLTPIAVIIAGGVVLKSAGKIEELQPLIDKIKAQQINFLGHGLGTEVYVQQERNTLLAAKQVMELTQAIDPELAQVSPELEHPNSLVHQELGELDSSRTNSERTARTSELATLESGISQQELDTVSRAISEGFTTSQIIKDILGYKGERYAAGKERLEQIKQQLGVEND